MRKQRPKGVPSEIEGKPVTSNKKNKSHRWYLPCRQTGDVGDREMKKQTRNMEYRIRNTNPGLRYAVLVAIISIILPQTLCWAALPSLRAGAVSLNGTWECALGTGAEEAWTPEGQAGLTWNTTTVPGENLDTTGASVYSIQFAWARRDFTLTTEQAEQLAIINWKYITMGASVYINGQFVGHNEPIGPFQVIIPPGTLQAGTNQIVMKVAGRDGVARANSGWALIPTGFTILWGGYWAPAIRGDIWIDFADTAYMKWILAIPDLANSQVTMRVTPDALNNVNNLSLDVTVRTWPGGQVFSQASGPVADLVPDPDPLGGTHSYLDVPMTGFQTWTHHTPNNLYTADIQLKQGAQVLDSATIRFGMREIKVEMGAENANYTMNGQTLWLRGAETFPGVWNTSPEQLYAHFITTCHAANVNFRRTHCLPPSKVLADICDEGGTMLLPEFPLTYNGVNPNFTPQEYDIWHQNCITDAAGWVTLLWNNPSAVIWVLSNESYYDNEWERGPFRDFVLALDPTRPTMLSGAGGLGGTVDNYDVHSLGPALPEGWEIRAAPIWKNSAGPNRTCGNSEYMNFFPRDWKWTGDDDLNNINWEKVKLGSELTAAMRRNRLDLIMWFGFDTRIPDIERAYYSFFSPILASLDLFDPSYTTDTEVTTGLSLMNDSWNSSDLQVELFLTSSDPEFLHNSPTFNNPVAQWSYDFTVPSDSVTPVQITWQTPLIRGNYWLTARATGSGISGNPVLSQRFLHVVKPAAIPAILTQKTFVVLGSDAKAVAFFNAKGLTTSSSTSNLDPNNDMVIIWNPANLTAAEKQSAADLCTFADAGGNVVVLSTALWDWTALCDVQIGTRKSSRAFLYGGAQHAMLNGILPEFFTRWNSVNRRGLVANNDLDNLSGANEILWIYQPGDTVVAEIPAASGNGMVLFSQLDIRDRLDNTRPEYDPVAERILVNILKMLDPGQSTNQPPQVDAGLDQQITLPNDTVNLDGTVTDPDDIPTTAWSKVSGPGIVTFGDQSAVDTTVTFSEAGVYVLRLTADDGVNNLVSDDITITVAASSFLYGDVNKDGKVNIQDVQCCVNHISGTQDWGNAADINKDGEVDQNDIEEIINIILSK